MSYDQLRWLVDEIAARTAEQHPALGIEAFTLAIDRRYRDRRARNAARC